MENIEFAVITKVPDPEDSTKELAGGNLAHASELYVEKDEGYVNFISEALRSAGMMPMILEPVFELGEIIVLDKEIGREVCPPGRKPSKWFIEHEVFDDIQDAIARSNEVWAERYGGP